MTTLSLLKTSVIAPVILMTAFASHASDVDENGFKVKIRCDTAEVMTKAAAIKGETPTGIKASNNTYNMEIYANKDTGSWKLMGINKNPATKFDHTCILQHGNSNFPYTSEKFYAVFFKNGEKPKIATATQDLKPNLN